MGKEYLDMLEEFKEIATKLNHYGVSCKTVDSKKFAKWLGEETGKEIASGELTRIPSENLATLEKKMSDCDFGNVGNIDAYLVSGPILFWSKGTWLWRHDEKHQICSAYYSGMINGTFIGQLYRYMRELELICDLEDRRGDFAKVGADFSFAHELDDDGRIVGTTCIMTGYEELESTTPCKINSDNVTLLFEWLLERECIERANELLVQYRERGIHYERREINYDSSRPKYVLGIQKKYFYAIPTTPGSGINDLCNTDVDGIAKMEKILAERIRMESEAQNASIEEDAAQDAETTAETVKADETVKEQESTEGENQPESESTQEEQTES